MNMKLWGPVTRCDLGVSIGAALVLVWFLKSGPRRGETMHTDEQIEVHPTTGVTTPLDVTEYQPWQLNLGWFRN
jgi:hypothetical protein